MLPDNFIRRIRTGIGSVRSRISISALKAAVLFCLTVASKLPGAIRDRITGQMLKIAALLCVGAVLMAALAGGAAIYEYRTNRFALWIGALLTDTNARRSTAGRLWKQIQSRAAVQETLDVRGTISLPETGKALPEAVSKGRYEMRRVPETGVPGYVAIWRTAIPPGESGRRPLPEMIESYRVFRQGLALMEAAQLSDAQYRGRARQEIESIYRLVGDIDFAEPAIRDTLEPALPDSSGDTDSAGVAIGDTLQPAAAMEDTLRPTRPDSSEEANSVAVADTLPSTHPDSLKASLFEELARDITARLKREERAALLRDYRAGRVVQIFLHQGLGLYQGEVYRDTEKPPILFEIGPASVVSALKIDISEAGR